MAYAMVKPPDAGGKKKKETVKQQQTEKARQAEMKATKTLPWKPVEDKGLTLLDRDAGQDPLYNWINDPSYREDYEAQYAKTFQTAFQDSPYTGQKASPFARSGYDRMNDNEIAIYNYYYAKGGKEAAERYLYNLQETLNGRVAQNLYGTVAGDTGLEMLFGAAAGIDGFESDLRSAFNFKDDYIAKTPHQIASAKVWEDLADTGFKLPDWLGGGSAGQLAYDAIGAAANMAPSILVSYATGVPMAGNALSGVSSAGNAYAQALNEGFDKDQARGYGLLTGASEMVLEKLLGGISAFDGNKLGKKAVQNLSNVDDALKMLGGKLGGSMISEFREEYLQEILDPVFRHITLKTEEEMNLLSPDALYAGFLGALFGTGVESVDAAVKGLPVDFDFIDSTADASEYAEFADIFEDIEGWEHLKSLPKAEQEAFVESLFDEAPVEAETPVTTVEILNPEPEISEPEDLPVEESEQSGIIKENGFNTTADPMREVTAAGITSHPKEINGILTELKEYNVEVIHRGNGMAYAPALTPGKAGQFIIDEEASYSAWMHEYKHFCDDRDDGFLGMRVFMDTAKCIKREVDAYNVEIELAKQAGRQDIVDRLEALKAKEVSRFERNAEID